MTMALSPLRRRLRRALGPFGAGLLLPVLLGNAYAADPQGGQVAEPGKAPAAGLTEPEDAAPPARVRLISQEQYFNTLSYVFGPDVAISAHFAPFRRTD